MNSNDALKEGIKYNLTLTQWGKSPKKQSVGVDFDNMTLYFECRIDKNALL